jgi:hypothetical protein
MCVDATKVGTSEVRYESQMPFLLARRRGVK